MKIVTPSTLATKFRYRAVVKIPSPPPEERARERRPSVSKFPCHSTSLISTPLFQTPANLPVSFYRARTPSGLTTSNIYFDSGEWTNWVQTRLDVETGGSNSFTHAINLIATHTDERGRTTSFTYDNLQRPVTVPPRQAQGTA